MSVHYKLSIGINGGHRVKNFVCSIKYGEFLVQLAPDGGLKLQIFREDPCDSLLMPLS